MVGRVGTERRNKKQKSNTPERNREKDGPDDEGQDDSLSGDEELLKKGTWIVKEEERKKRESTDETGRPRLLPMHEYVVERGSSKRLQHTHRSGAGATGASGRPTARLCLVGQVPPWYTILENLRRRRCMDVPFNCVESARRWLVKCRCEAPTSARARMIGRQRGRFLHAPRPSYAFCLRIETVLERVEQRSAHIGRQRTGWVSRVRQVPLRLNAHVTSTASPVVCQNLQHVSSHTTRHHRPERAGNDLELAASPETTFRRETSRPGRQACYPPITEKQRDVVTFASNRCFGWAPCQALGFCSPRASDGGEASQPKLSSNVTFSPITAKTPSSVHPFR